MQVYTSNYRKYKGVNGVRISNTAPEWATYYKTIPSLFPKRELVWQWNKLKKLPVGTPERETFWSEVFVLTYWNQLQELSFEAILRELSDGDVLLCYCKSECHRHILACWLRLYGVEVTEI